MADKAKIIDRVRKLLELATSSNEHEAATAATRAQELMERHQLLHADLEPEEYAVEVLDSKGRFSRWRVILASGVANAHSCEIFTSRIVGRKGKTQTVIVGDEADVQAASYVYRYLEREVFQHGAALVNKTRAYRESYREGMAARLHKRVVEAKAEVWRDAARGASEVALARIDIRKSAVDKVREWIADTFDPEQGAEWDDPDWEAAVAGSKDADSIALAPRGPAIGERQEALAEQTELFKEGAQ